MPPKTDGRIGLATGSDVRVDGERTTILFLNETIASDENRELGLQILLGKQKIIESTETKKHETEEK